MPEFIVVVYFLPDHNAPEFVVMFIMPFYILPDGKANIAIIELNDNISSRQNKHPSSFHMVAGYFSNVTLTGS